MPALLPPGYAPLPADLVTAQIEAIAADITIDLPRPRHLEDTAVAGTARDILNDLREEIDKSLEAEYNDETRR